MFRIINNIRSIFFTKRLYRFFAAIIALFLIAYLIPLILIVCQVVLAIFIMLILADYIVLFTYRQGVKADRKLPQRFSNGDENAVTVFLKNDYPFQISVMVIDEIPVQFQDRNFKLSEVIDADTQVQLHYTLKPLTRGEYIFNDLNIFVRSPLSLIIRRYKIPLETPVKVYPSFLQLRKFELIAFSNQLSESGTRKIRRIGHSLEFEQIKEYVSGDDIRSINWKATGRKGGQLMVNNFSDERSQQIYCLIDKGRVMKMPFKGMTLLDYSINASLVLSRVALVKADKAGLITFAEDTDQFVSADRKSGQMETILETLYHQQTKFNETSFEKLYSFIRKRIPQRSLLILFTNFESLTALHRQLPYLRSLAKKHLLLVVFFENTGLRDLINEPVKDVESLYTRTIAERFSLEKRLIIKELKQHGILTLLTAPEDLTIHAVNKYLELKSRQAI